MYNVEIEIRDTLTEMPIRKEHISMYSLWAARNYGRKIQHCLDVGTVDIIDTETGEVMLSLHKGEVLWDSEG